MLRPRWEPLRVFIPVPHEPTALRSLSMFEATVINVNADNMTLTPKIKAEMDSSRLGIYPH